MQQFNRGVLHDLIRLSQKSDMQWNRFFEFKERGSFEKAKNIVEMLVKKYLSIDTKQNPLSFH